MQAEFISLIGPDGKLVPLAEIEAKAITHALATTPTRLEAAKALGIGRSTLYRKIDELGLETVRSAPPLPPPSTGHQDVRSLVRSMADEDVETIQWIVEVRGGEHLSLTDISQILA